MSIDLRGWKLPNEATVGVSALKYGTNLKIWGLHQNGCYAATIGYHAMKLPNSMFLIRQLPRHRALATRSWPTQNLHNY